MLFSLTNVHPQHERSLCLLSFCSFSVGGSRSVFLIMSCVVSILVCVFQKKRFWKVKTRARRAVRRGHFCRKTKIFILFELSKRMFGRTKNIFHHRQPTERGKPKSICVVSVPPSDFWLCYSVEFRKPARSSIPRELCELDDERTGFKLSPPICTLCFY